MPAASTPVGEPARAEAVLADQTPPPSSAQNERGTALGPPLDATGQLPGYRHCPFLHLKPLQQSLLLAQA
jgi:hypothetical protein